MPSEEIATAPHEAVSRATLCALREHRSRANTLHPAHQVPTHQVPSINSPRTRSIVSK